MLTVLVLLGIAMATALLVRQSAVPYTVALVVVGVGLSAAGAQSGITLDRTLVVSILLPILLFEAALRVDLRTLQQALLPIAVLAIPGVVISTLVIAALLTTLAGLPLRTTLVFGALISATDPIAVLAIFRRLGLPETLTMVVEGESVLNDGTSLVLFSLLLPVAQGLPFHPLAAAGQFVVVVIGGGVIGGAAGWVAAKLVGLTSDHLVELGLTALLAYASFLLAQAAGFSGVIACVSAGLAFAAGSRKTLSQPAEELLGDVWEFAAFLINSVLFLLIGLQVHLSQLLSGLPIESLAVAAMLIARAAVVYGLGFALRLIRRPIPVQHMHLVFWSGLRGALAIALALSLPASLAGRDLLLRLTLAAVLFTLLVQGLTVQPLIKLIRVPTSGSQS